MRIFNLNGRLSLGVGPGEAVDVERASGGRFAADVQAIYERWAEFRAWASDYDGPGDQPIVDALLGPPVPRPRQLFAIGLNYRDHAAEAGLELPETPMVFTKFPGSITGPHCDIQLPSEFVDFEVELVAVVGKHARRVSESDGWSYIAGLTAGQDLSERAVQLSGPPPQQFSIGKSFEGFAPIGPALVSPDEFDDPDDIELGCLLGGVQMQKSRTAEFVFTVPQLIAYLSSVLPLFPGDLVFTGTPGGVGWLQEPRRTIAAQEELVTQVAGVGEMRHRFTTDRAKETDHG